MFSLTFSLSLSFSNYLSFPFPLSFSPFPSLTLSLPPLSLTHTLSLLTSEKVAVKIIDKTKLDEDSRRLLSREIVCMEWLDHPNIIRLYEVID